MTIDGHTCITDDGGTPNRVCRACELEKAGLKPGREFFCEHANEAPNICPCPPTCGCHLYTCRGKASSRPATETEFRESATRMIEKHRPSLERLADAPTKQRPGDQPLPVKNNLPAIQDLVMADIEVRKKLGISRYGTLLQPFNGRDVMLDIYEELLDAAIYMRQALYERDGH